MAMNTVFKKQGKIRMDSCSSIGPTSLGGTWPPHLWIHHT